MYINNCKQFGQVARNQPKKSGQYNHINTVIVKPVKDFVRPVKLITIKSKSLNSEFFGPNQCVSIFIIRPKGINNDLFTV